MVVRLIRLRWLALATAVFVLIGISSASAAVEEGTVLSSENIDELYDKTFAGKTIGELLTPYHEYFVREEGVKLRLSKGYEWPREEQWEKATELYHEQAHLDEKGQLHGWKAGLPFPNVSPGDERAALKVSWNFFAGEPKGTVRDHGIQYSTFMDMNKNGEGIDRYQLGAQTIAFLKGRYNFPVEEAPDSKFSLDERVYRKFYIISLYPQSRKGVGTYILKYFDGRYDDIWAYLRSIRRVRRLGGGSWTDPFPGQTVWVGDDQNAWSGHPLWYDRIELEGKVTRLAPFCENPDCRNILYDKDRGQTYNDHVPGFPYEKPSISNWFYDPNRFIMVPREMYKLTIHGPAFHIYSKRVLYIDTQSWFGIYAFTYDKQGEWWKAFSGPRAAVEGLSDGYIGNIYTAWYGIGKKSRRNVGGGISHTRVNPPEITHKDLSLSVLRQGRAVGKISY